MNKTKEKVKSGNLSAKEAYDYLFPLIEDKYARHIPTLRWLKNIIDGKPINKPNTKNKKNLAKKIK